MLSLLCSAISAQESNSLSDDELIKLYTGLRVADVSDGMDFIGLHDQGLMDPSIEVLWKDIENFDHHIYSPAILFNLPIFYSSGNNIPILLNR